MLEELANKLDLDDDLWQDIIMLMHMWAEKKLSWFAIEIRNKKCVKLPQKLPIGVESKFSNISHVTCYNLAMGSINQSILCHS